MLTTRYLKYWHTYFNRLLFQGELSKPTLPVGNYRKGWVGACVVEHEDDPVHIHISPSLSAKDARRVLLHEMVHQWQHESGLPMNHGRSYKQWKRPCRLLTGLSLWP